LSIFKILEIVGNFYKSANKWEIAEVLIIPLIFLLVGWYTLTFMNPQQPQDIIRVQEFINEFVNTLLTIASLLTAFEVASITILMTSPSKNIELAKKEPTNRKTIRGFGISYYQLILIRNFYTAIILMLLIFIGVMYKLLIRIIPLKFQKVILIFEIGLLVHAMAVLGFVLSHLYYLLWKEKLSKEDIKP